MLSSATPPATTLDAEQAALLEALIELGNLTTEPAAETAVAPTPVEAKEETTPQPVTPPNTPIATAEPADAEAREALKSYLRAGRMIMANLFSHVSSISKAILLDAIDQLKSLEKRLQQSSAETNAPITLADHQTFTQILTGALIYAAVQDDHTYKLHPKVHPTQLYPDLRFQELSGGTPWSTEKYIAIGKRVLAQELPFSFEILRGSWSAAISDTTRAAYLPPLTALLDQLGVKALAVEEEKEIAETTAAATPASTPEPQSTAASLFGFFKQNPLATAAAVAVAGVCIARMIN
jgi:hypothetical protein